MFRRRFNPTVHLSMTTSYGSRRASRFSCHQQPATCMTCLRGVRARVKAYVVRAEDARLLGDMPLVRKMYAELHNLNRRLVGEYAKRANNHRVSWFFEHARSRETLICFRFHFQATGHTRWGNSRRGSYSKSQLLPLNQQLLCESIENTYACEVAAWILRFFPFCPERWTGPTHFQNTEYLCHDWLLAWYTTNA